MMFSGSALADEHPTRRWTALVSFALQAAAVAAAMVYPLLYPQSLPRLMRPIFVPASNAEVPILPAKSSVHSSSALIQHPLVVNNRRFTFQRSNHQATDAGDVQPPDFTAVVGPGVPGVANSVAAENVRPVLTPAPTHSLRTSVVMEGNLIHRVEPQYPAMAKQIHLEGTVVLRAIISRDGNIKRVQVASGPGLLAGAAREAVRQWRYRPYLLNNEPVEVETQITVNFILQR